MSSCLCGELPASGFPTSGFPDFPICRCSRFPLFAFSAFPPMSPYEQFDYSEKRTFFGRYGFAIGMCAVVVVVVVLFSQMLTSHKGPTKHKSAELVMIRPVTSPTPPPPPPPQMVQRQQLTEQTMVNDQADYAGRAGAGGTGGVARHRHHGERAGERVRARAAGIGDFRGKGGAGGRAPAISSGPISAGSRMR